jgi:hypothetical protein
MGNVGVIRIGVITNSMGKVGMTLKGENRNSMGHVGFLLVGTIRKVWCMLEWYGLVQL